MKTKIVGERLSRVTVAKFTVNVPEKLLITINTKMVINNYSNFFHTTV
jgi:hypothetical protein